MPETLCLMNMRIKIINLGLSITAICILLFDYFISNEFFIERGYLDIFIFLLILNISRIVFESKIRIHAIGIFTNICLLGFLLYNIQILLILCFGIGFTGRDFPLIMGAAIIVNLLFSGSSFIEIIHFKKKKTKHNN